MKPWLPLRIAAVVTLLYALGHLSGFPWTPATGGAARDVIQAMKSTRFDVVGTSRTYWDFYRGFGLIIGVSAIAEAVAFWLVAGLAQRGTQHLRPLIATFALAYLGNAILGWLYFFAIPIVFNVVIAAALLWAYAVARHGPVVASVNRL